MNDILKKISSPIDSEYSKKCAQQNHSRSVPRLSCFDRPEPESGQRFPSKDCRHSYRKAAKDGIAVGKQWKHIQIGG